MLLVSILGDFHSSIFPIFYEFKDSIHTHLIVYDDAFKERLSSKKILNSLKEFSKNHTLNIETVSYSIDEDSYESIVALIKKIQSLESNAQNIYINTTDGLSNIGVILGSKLLNLGAKVIAYDMYENSYNLTTQNSIVTQKLSSKMSIKEHFELKGIRVKATEDKSFADKNAKSITKLFELYHKQFALLKADVTMGTIKEKKYKEALAIVKELNLDPLKHKKEITGGLFEWYVYLLVKELKFDDIEVGVTVESSFSNSTTIKNEFDILIMKDNHLNMIECKFTKRVDIKALVYKYSTLLNFIDDDGKMMILTQKGDYSYDLYTKSEPQLEPYRRALVNKILLRGSILDNRDEFINDAREYLKLV